MKRMTTEEISEYLGKHPMFNVCFRDAPEAALKDGDVRFVDAEYYCATNYFEAYIKGYEDAAGKRPATVKAALVYYDGEKHGVEYPLDEIIIVKE